MKDLILPRYCYDDNYTAGRLYLSNDDDDYLETLERPWIAGPAGGMPFESCVPDGVYDLIPYTRSKGRGDVYALRNPDLGVYFTKQERGAKEGRYKILIHVANRVEEVVGCIAPGLTKTIAGNVRQVRSSSLAMKRLMASPRKTLTIEPGLGTED